MRIANQPICINDFYQNQDPALEENDIYNLDVKIKDASMPSFTQFDSNVVGCGGSATVTACSGGCCQSVCSSC